MLNPKANNPLSKILIGIILLVLVGIIAVLVVPRLLTKGLPMLPQPASNNPIQNAQELIGQGKLDEAKVILQAQNTPEAVLLLSQLSEKAGKPEDAIPQLERAYKEFGTSPDHPRVAVAYARALDRANRSQDATRIYQEVVDSAPPELRTPALTGLGLQAEKAKDFLKARDLFRKAVTGATWDSPEWNEAVMAMGRVNVALIFSSAETPESKWYEVQRGDNITNIGNNLNTTQGLLMRANGLEENPKLNLGQRLKYTPKDFRVLVERSKTRLFLLDKDGIFRMYPAGLGKPGHETTPGSYKIGNKEKNPIWHKPGDTPVPALDPRNELGTRWMPLVPTQQGLPRDLGLHGTIHPESVPGFVSNGCARMLPPDVEELYDLIVRSTPVDIVEKVTPEMITNPGQGIPPAVSPMVPNPAVPEPPATAQSSVTPPPTVSTALPAPAVPGKPVSPGKPESPKSKPVQPAKSTPDKKTTTR